MDSNPLEVFYTGVRSACISCFLSGIGFILGRYPTSSPIVQSAGLKILGDMLFYIFNPAITFYSLSSGVNGRNMAEFWPMMVWCTITILMCRLLSWVLFENGVIQSVWINKVKVNFSAIILTGPFLAYHNSVFILLPITEAFCTSYFDPALDVKWKNSAECAVALQGYITLYTVPWHILMWCWGYLQLADSAQLILLSPEELAIRAKEKEQESVRSKLFSLFRPLGSPTMLALLLGIVCSMFSQPKQILYTYKESPLIPVGSTLSMLGKVAVPLSCIVSGAALGNSVHANYLASIVRDSIQQLKARIAEREKERSDLRQTNVDDVFEKKIRDEIKENEREQEDEEERALVAILKQSEWDLSANAARSVMGTDTAPHHLIESLTQRRRNQQQQQQQQQSMHTSDDRSNPGGLHHASDEADQSNANQDTPNVSEHILTKMKSQPFIQMQMRKRMTSKAHMDLMHHATASNTGLGGTMGMGGGAGGGRHSGLSMNQMIGGQSHSTDYETAIAYVEQRFGADTNDRGYTEANASSVDHHDRNFEVSPAKSRAEFAISKKITETFVGAALNDGGEEEELREMELQYNEAQKKTIPFSWSFGIAFTFVRLVLSPIVGFFIFYLFTLFDSGTFAKSSDRWIKLIILVEFGLPSAQLMMSLTAKEGLIRETEFWSKIYLMMYLSSTVTVGATLAVAVLLFF